MSHTEKGEIAIQFGTEQQIHFRAEVSNHNIQIGSLMQLTRLQSGRLKSKRQIHLLIRPQA